MYIYLDNAATSSPKPQAVIDEVRRALVEYNANPGRSAHAPALAAAHCVYAAREAVARLIGAAQSSSVAFASNCTDALNLAIKGCLRRGDHVISTLLEHNSVLRPLSMLHDSGQIEAYAGLAASGRLHLPRGYSKKTAEEYAADRRDACFERNRCDPARGGHWAVGKCARHFVPD